MFGTNWQCKGKRLYYGADGLVYGTYFVVDFKNNWNNFTNCPCAMSSGSLFSGNIQGKGRISWEGLLY